jgi:hypothetical protein
VEFFLKIVDVDSILGSLHRLEVGIVSDVSDVHVVFIYNRTLAHTIHFDSEGGKR